MSSQNSLTMPKLYVVNSLSNQDEIENNISSLSASLSATSSYLQGEINEVSGNLEDLSASVASLPGTISDLSSFLEDQILEISGNLEDLSASVASLPDTLSTFLTISAASALSTILSDDIEGVANTLQSNSGNWESTLTTVTTNSASWMSEDQLFAAISADLVGTTATVNVNSSNWQSVFNSVYGNSASWNEVSSFVFNNSAYWQSVYDSMQANSASWNSTSSSVSENSAIWNESNSILSNNSSLWLDTTYTLSANSSDWESSNSIIADNSASWNSTSATLAANSANWNSQLTKANVKITFDGSGYPPETGIYDQVRFTKNCTLNKYTLWADTTGTVQIDIQKGPLSANPLTSANSIITTGTKPSLSNSISTEVNNLSGYDTTILSGDIMKMILETCSECTNIVLEMEFI
jgi:hypothetical protein